MLKKDKNSKLCSEKSLYMLNMRGLSNFASLYKSSMPKFRVKDMTTVLRSVAFSVG